MIHRSGIFFIERHAAQGTSTILNESYYVYLAVSNLHESHLTCPQNSSKADPWSRGREVAHGVLRSFPKSEKRTTF